MNELTISEKTKCAIEDVLQEHKIEYKTDENVYIYKEPFQDDSDLDVLTFARADENVNILMILSIAKTNIKNKRRYEVMDYFNRVNKHVFNGAFILDPDNGVISFITSIDYKHIPGGVSREMLDKILRNRLAIISTYLPPAELMNINKEITGKESFDAITWILDTMEKMVNIKKENQN